jgi:hypothetical protein
MLGMISEGGWLRKCERKGNNINESRTEKETEIHSDFT